MNRSILFSLLAASVVVISASDLQASVFRRQCHREPACVKRIKQASNTEHPSRTWSTFPTWTWGLGNHYGEWPPYYHK
jgi:hypothetical protein